MQAPTHANTRVPATRRGSHRSEVKVRKHTVIPLVYSAVGLAVTSAKMNEQNPRNERPHGSEKCVLATTLVFTR